MTKIHLALLCSLVAGASAQQGPRENFHTFPNSTFFQQPVGESAITINDTAGSISALQGLIDAARATDPDKIIVIKLQAGTHYSVTADPLVLGSRMCLTGEGATIEASSPAIAATALIRITPGATYSSVNNVTLNGVSADVHGIEAAGVSRVNIDDVTVTDTGRDGIFLQGLGILTFDNQMTVTRCHVSGVESQSGIHIVDATQPLCLENVCDNNSTGITVGTSSRATLVNNRCDSNTTSGIALPDATLSRISNNSCSGNPAGIALGAGSQYNFIVSNDLRAGEVGIDLTGTGHTLYDNMFPSGIVTPLAVSGSATNHNIVTTSIPLVATGQRYFHPPTTPNNHVAAIMNGKTRTDLTITETTLSAIQTQYDAARALDPDTVIVLHLTAPLITGDATLVLGSNTCVLISGTILLNPGITAISALDATFLSVSGGTIDGANTPGRNGMSFEGCARLLVDHVTLQNFGDKNSRVASSDVIEFSTGGTPCIVAYSSINGGAARGIWTKNATAGFIFTDNTISNVNMDGIDLDGFTNGALVKFNTLSSNVRTGIFVEEAAKHNQLIGNSIESNTIGINVYSFAAGPTTYNSIIANRCESNGRGIRIGAASGYLSEHNFCFNNSVTNTTTAIPQQGALDSQGAGSENYFSQHYLNGNPLPIASTVSAVFFNSPGKSSPTVDTAPTASAITYGQTLADSTLGGGGASVPGSFAFTTPGTTPDAGTADHEFTFTPNDTANYSTATGLVSVTVNPAPGFATWASGHGLSGGDALWNSDPDEDGLKNGVEYVLGGIPTDCDVGTKSPTGSISGNSYIFTFTRTDASETDTTVTVEYGDDLSFSNSVPIGATSAGTVSITEHDAEPDTVVVAIPTVGATRIFVRVHATSN